MVSLEAFIEYVQEMTTETRAEFDRLKVMTLGELTDLYRAAQDAERKKLVKAAMKVRVLEMIVEEYCGAIDDE